VGLDNLGAAGALRISGAGSQLRLKVAVVFGVFEASMPLLGFLLGDSIAAGFGGHAKLLVGLVLCLAGVFALVQEHAAEAASEWHLHA
jgi:putative Mn2+ efflux pump MntP